MSAPQVATVTRKWVVANKPKWVTAKAQRFPGFTKLIVYRSIRARDEQSWMVPVLEMMHGKCVAWVHAVKIQDRSMVGYAAWDLHFHVFETCPGTRVSHDCELEDHGGNHRKAVSIGESVEAAQTVRLPVVPVPREAG